MARHPSQGWGFLDIFRYQRGALARPGYFFHSMSMSSIARRLLPVLALIVVGIVIGVDYLFFPASTKYATYMRHDGKYSIVVYRFPNRFHTLPGHASDSPGEVQLLDRDGKMLRQVRVQIVQWVEKVEWSDQRVYIKLVADWELP